MVLNSSSAEVKLPTSKAPIMQDKVQDSLDAEKISVSSQIFNGVEAEDLEVTDEEIDAAFESGDFEENEDTEELE
jgi:hypothetical protein